MAGHRQVKAHALTVAAVGPVLLVLVTAPVGADGRMILMALLLAAVLLLTSAISGHAIATYLDAQRRWRSGEASRDAEWSRSPDDD